MCGAPRRRPPRHLAWGTTWRLQSPLQNTVAEISLNSNHVQRIMRNERRHRQFGMRLILSSTVNSRPKGSKSSCVPFKAGADDELRDIKVVRAGIRSVKTGSATCVGQHGTWAGSALNFDSRGGRDARTAVRSAGGRTRPRPLASSRPRPPGPAGTNLKVVIVLLRTAVRIVLSMARVYFIQARASHSFSCPVALAVARRLRLRGRGGARLL